MDLWPFFTYFGGKWRSAPHYPPPSYAAIVEPFAGSAGYAVRYHDRRVTLCEADPVVANLWRYLIQVTKSEIESLPEVANDDNLNSAKFAGLAPEARSLIGFWLNKGMTGPCKTPSRWMRDGIRPNSQWGPAIRARIAAQVEAIRHWTVLDDYRAAPDVQATWLVDPPYIGRLGQRYRAHTIDYAALAEWCRSRRGQVIVCENEGATWLPFRPFRAIKGTEGAKRTGVSMEAIWTNSQDLTGGVEV